MAPLHELEGTWDEIAAHSEEFKGHRLKLVVLPEPDNGNHSAEPENSQDRVSRLLRQWNEEAKTEFMPPIPKLPGETSLQAISRKWAQEDAGRTDAEIEADDQLWGEIEKALLDNPGLQLKQPSE
jgi:hypothetical protein